MSNIEDIVDVMEKEDKEKRKNNNYGLKNGDKVKIILLNKKYPTRTLNELDNYNQEEQDEADAIGREPKLKEKSFKELGVAWNYAVIECNNKSIFLDKNGVFNEPKYSCYGVLELLPPPVLFRGYVKSVYKDKVENKKVFTRQKGIVGYDEHYNNPIIRDVFPSSFPAKYWAKDSDNSSIPDDNIYALMDNGKVRLFYEMNDKPLEEDLYLAYSDLINAEVKRIGLWQKLIAKYSELDNESALQYLELCIAKQFGICSLVDNKLKFADLHSGTTFKAKIAKKKDDKYFNIIPFEWDGDTYQIYTKLDSTDPDDTESKQAVDIMNLKEEMIQKRIEAKSKSKSKRKAGLDGDEPPWVTDDGEEENSFVKGD